MINQLLVHVLPSVAFIFFIYAILKKISSDEKKTNFMYRTTYNELINRIEKRSSNMDIEILKARISECEDKLKVIQESYNPIHPSSEKTNDIPNLSDSHPTH